MDVTDNIRDCSHFYRITMEDWVKLKPNPPKNSLEDNQRKSILNQIKLPLNKKNWSNRQSQQMNYRCF